MRGLDRKSSIYLCFKDDIHLDKGSGIGNKNRSVLPKTKMNGFNEFLKEHGEFLKELFRSSETENFYENFEDFALDVFVELLPN